jgi:hypothetical protein
MSKVCLCADPEIIVLSIAQPTEPANSVAVDAIIDSETQHFYEDFCKSLRNKAR